MMQAVLGADAKFLADSLFRVFDEDNSGNMDFTEYILALNATRFVGN
jgi:Ca2+-binding EF-hand superfamily protein